MSRADQLASLERQIIESGLPVASARVLAYANGLSSAVTVAIGSQVLRSAAGATLTLRDLVLSINLATLGAGGLDTGVLAANSWYSTWAIWNPATKVAAGIGAVCPVLACATAAGSAVVTGLPSTAGLRAGLPFMGGTFPAGVVIKSVDGPTQITASLPATAAGAASLCFLGEPVLPAGYTHKARVGMVRTDASKLLLSFIQAGNLVAYRPAVGSNVANYPTIANGAGGTATALVAVSVLGVVPPTALEIKLQLLGTTSNNSCAAPSAAFVGGLSGQNTPPLNTAGSTNTSSNLQGVFMLEGGFVYYYSQSTAGWLQCAGWRDDL